MSTRRVLCLALVAATAAAIGQSVWSRSLPLTEDQIRAQQQPASSAVTKLLCAANHNVGKISLCQTNYGTFGTGFVTGTALDCFTGQALKSCEYPKGSGVDYLFAGAFWIGAVVGRDTCVSVGADGWQNCREMDPEESPIGDMQRLSIIDPSKPEFAGAKSEQDIIGVYTDRYTTGVSNLCQPGNDVVNGLGHRPLNIQVREASYAWSYSYAEDFVLFDYTITNKGNRPLSNVYMGVYVDGDVGATSDLNKAQDDVTGFLDSVPTPDAFNGDCTGVTHYGDSTYIWKDNVNMAWIADNDGNFANPPAATSVTGTRIVRTPSDSLRVSYNWWIGNANKSLDYGPQKRATNRDLGTGGHGTPEGDRNKYWYLRNGEFDFDQVFTCDYTVDTAWEPAPSGFCTNLSKGIDTRYLLSFGPFNMFPGQDLPLSFAYVAGEHFHRNEANGDLLTKANDPHGWYAGVDFSDLALNSVWASWLYDNPGYSSPGSNDPNYLGKFRVCTAHGTPDTIYYTGDGVADFKGASPPPAPDIWLYPYDKKVRVRWNGFRSETTKDVFSKIRDFEGYRVYKSLDDRPASFSVIQSFDFDDYNKWVYVRDTIHGTADFVLKTTPILLDSLRRAYGGPDSTRWNLWDPLHYTRTNPFRKPGFPDSIFFFTAQDYNQSLSSPGQKIEKTYPNAPFPGEYVSPDSVPAALRDSFLTDDGYFKYYEYQMFVDSLLPTIPYYFNVTAFDFGSPASGLGSLETSPTVGYKTSYAAGSYARNTTSSNQVYVFPNPYRADGGYQRDGYEGRDPISRGKFPDRQRRIHFANVPLNCTIKIFTLDGDLVRELKHPDIQSPCQEDPTVACWDMITRNTQLVVSGIYYWTVEDDKGNTQIGKLVIIM